MNTAYQSRVRGAGFSSLLLCLALNAVHGQQDARDLPGEVFPEDQTDGAAPVDRPGYAQVRNNLADTYAESMANEAFYEATVVAKQLVEISMVEKGQRNLDTAAALSDLGYAQYSDEAYDAAILNFKASVAMFERLENNLSARLIEPLRGLGHAQLADGRPDLARDSFEMAVHINNVNEGPLNPEQVELLEAMADSLAAAGDIKGASVIFDRIYQIAARVHGARTVGMLPTLQKRARWSHDHGLFKEEQEIYRQMIRIVDDTRGRDDLALMEPLTGLAYSYLYADSTWRLDRRFLSSITSGENFLKRSLRIARDHPNGTWEHERDALLALADYYLFASNFSDAKRQYREAWQLLSAGEDRLASRALHLEQPVRLQLASPPKYVTQRFDKNVPPDILKNREYRRGHVIVEFDVTVEGRTTAIQIVEARPAGLDDLENQVVERVTRAIYRPRHKFGFPAQSQKLVYRHDFFYLDSDQTAESP